MVHRKQWRMHPTAKKEFKDLPRNGQQGLGELMTRLKRDMTLPREVGMGGTPERDYRNVEGTDQRFSSAVRAAS